MTFIRRLTLADVPLMLVCALGPVLLYHLIVSNNVMHRVREDRKSEVMHWFANNRDLIATMERHGIVLMTNTAIPGSIRVSLVDPQAAVDHPDKMEAAHAGLAMLRDELFKRRCPYGITLVSIDGPDKP
jgi:hypothetical protein